MSKEIQAKKAAQKEDAKRTSFILKTEISRKLNVISAMDGVSITELVNGALSDLIEKWEKKNGPISIK